MYKFLYTRRKPVHFHFRNDRNFSKHAHFQTAASECILRIERWTRAFKYSVLRVATGSLARMLEYLWSKLIVHVCLINAHHDAAIVQRLHSIHDQL